MLSRIAEIGIKGVIVGANVLDVAVGAYCINHLFGYGWALAFIVASALFTSCPYLLFAQTGVTIYFWYRTGNWVPFALDLAIPAVAYLLVLPLTKVLNKGENNG